MYETIITLKQAYASVTGSDMVVPVVQPIDDLNDLPRQQAALALVLKKIEQLFASIKDTQEYVNGLNKDQKTNLNTICEIVKVLAQSKDHDYKISKTCLAVAYDLYYLIMNESMPNGWQHNLDSAIDHYPGTDLRKAQCYFRRAIRSSNYLYELTGLTQKDTASYLQTMLVDLVWGFELLGGKPSEELKKLAKSYLALILDNRKSENVRKRLHYVIVKLSLVDGCRSLLLEILREHLIQRSKKAINLKEETGFVWSFFLNNYYAGDNENDREVYQFYLALILDREKFVGKANEIDKLINDLAVARKSPRLLAHLKGCSGWCFTVQFGGPDREAKVEAVDNKEKVERRFLGKVRAGKTDLKVKEVILEEGEMSFHEFDW